MKYRYLLIITVGILYRLPPILRYGFVLQEYDPYFNYKVTKYLSENGFFEFLSWKDEKVWHPYGRNIASTCYPGMMIYTVICGNILGLFNINMYINELCVIFPLIGSIFTFFGMIKLSSFISVDRNITTISLFLMTTTASFLGRSTGGFYDYECISIGLLLWCFYYYLKCIYKTSVFNIFKLIFFYLNLASSWGGYIFFIYMVSVHSLLILIVKSVITLNKKYIVLSKILPEFEDENYILQYNEKGFVIFYIVGNTLIYFIPIIGKNIFISEEMIIPHLIFALHLYKTPRIRIPLILISLIFCILIPKYVQKSKIFDLIIFKGKKSALCESVSEHTQRNFYSFIHDVHLIILFLPASIKHFYRLEFIKGSFMLLYYITSIFIAQRMQRLLVPASACFCIAAAYSINEFYLLALEKNISKMLRFVLIIVFTYYILHNFYIATNIYSRPDILLESKNGDVIYDFQDAHNWLNKNNKEGVILAWWDYGYQINAQTRLTTLCDNNTCRLDRIKLVARILLSNELDGYRLCIENGIDYVYIVSGIKTGYKQDYIGKLYWIYKIASEDLLFNLKITESILYRMSYHNNQNLYFKTNQSKGIYMDLYRFKCIYSSRNDIVKIFKVNKIQ